MKYRIKGMLFILCIFLFASCSSEKQENYYRKVRLDGTYSIIGRFPVADELAKKIDCYRFVYNKDGQIAKIEYLEKDKITRDTYFGVERQ